MEYRYLCKVPINILDDYCWSITMDINRRLQVEENY